MGPAAPLPSGPLRMPLHPLPCPDPVGPASLDSLMLVPGGAKVAGATADALIIVDVTEQSRRKAAGLGAVTSLPLLDALLNLPLGMPVPKRDLAEPTWQQLLLAPAGVVQLDDRWVTRVLTPPLTVAAALVRGHSWRQALRRAGCFAPFTQRILLLDRAPKAGYVWEAAAAGVGVWVGGPGEVQEVHPPEVFVRRYWKAAGWRFAERANASAQQAAGELLAGGLRAESAAQASCRPGGMLSGDC